MSIRAEMRRQQREAEKRAAKTAKNLALLTGHAEADIKPLVTPDMVANFPATKIASLTGTKVETLNWWIKAREKELFEYCEKETIKTAQEKLWRAENHTMFINILISLLAIKMTWGFTKANIKWLQNLNAASFIFLKILQSRAVGLPFRIQTRLCLLRLWISVNWNSTASTSTKS